MEPIIESIKKFGRWSIRVFRWLFWEAKIIWITLLTIIGVFFFCYMSAGTCISAGTWEVRIRYSGLVLELLGIGTVVYGLKETLKLHLPGKIGDWIKRFPKFDGTNNTNDIFVRLHGFDSDVSGFMSYSPAPDTPIDEQVALLWESLNQTNAQMSKIQ